MYQVDTLDLNNILYTHSGRLANRVRAKLQNCCACVCKSDVEIRIAGSSPRRQLNILLLHSMHAAPVSTNLDSSLGLCVVSNAVIKEHY